MNAELEQWLASLRPLMGVLVIDLELAAAHDRWVRSEAGPWGGTLAPSTLDDRATHYARAWRSLASSAAAVVTTETGTEKLVLQAVDAQRVVAFLFDPKTPLGLARLHVLRTMPQLLAAFAPAEEQNAGAKARPTGPPITASYSDSNPVGAEEDDAVEPLSDTDERPGLPPPTQPPGEIARNPTPSPPGPLPLHPSVSPLPPGPVPLSAGPIPTTPGVGIPSPPAAVPAPTANKGKQAAPTLTSADQFVAARSIEDDETEPGDVNDELPPETRVHREAAAEQDSAQYAGPVAGATRPTTTLTEASTETAARGVRILAYLDAHAEDAHLALLRVSLQTGLSVETLRDPENLTDDEVDFVAASVRRILGRPLEM